MWELAFYALTISGGALVSWWGQRLRWRLQLWQDVAASCGFSEVESLSVWNLYLVYKPQAGLGGMWIGHGKNGTRVSVKVPGPPGFQDVRLHREPHRPELREIEVGDEVFDCTFFIEGPMRLVCALLDAENRRRLLSVNAEGELALAHGMLQANLSDAQLPRILPLLVELCRRFVQPIDEVRRLTENALCDPEAGVRLRNLLLLIRQLPEDPRTIETLRAARSDATPEIRLRAAMELGTEGRDVLLELAESEVADAWSAQALAIVGRDLPFERARDILLRALRRRHIQTARACLEALGHRGAAAVDVLAKVLAREQGELAVAAAQALGTNGSAAAEPSLILALQREEMDLRVAAANALARVGSAAAVLPLKEAAESSRDNDLRRATRQAIAEIQSRAKGASPGQLSLAGAEAGQLSLAQAEAGELSLATEAAGQLSLPSKEPGQLSLSDDEKKLKPAPGGAA
jgi:HEAT repeat protein